MRMFITSKNKYLSNDMKIFGTCSIPLTNIKHVCVFQILQWLPVVHKMDLAPVSQDAKQVIFGYFSIRNLYIVECNIIL